MTGKIIAYRLEPVHETPPGGVATAAVMTCLATGETLSGMGGGGEYLSPDLVQAMRDGRIIKGDSEDEIALLKFTSDLRWEADRRAIERWHAAGGDDLTWPDHADLVVWLLEQLSEALKAKAATDG